MAHYPERPTRSRILAGPVLVLALGVLHTILGTPRAGLGGFAAFYATAVIASALLGGARSAVAAAVIAVAFVGGMGIPAAGHAEGLVAVGLVAGALVAGIVGASAVAINHRRLERIAVRRVVERYRTLLEDLGAIVWEFDVTRRRVTFVSPTVERILGQTPAAMMESETLWLEAQHPDDRPLTLALQERFERGSREERIVHRMLRPDGRVVWLQTAIRIGKGERGALLERGVSIDVSAHKHAEEEQLRALSLVTATLESTVDGILVVDRDGRITSFNRRFVEMWRIPEEVIRAGDDERALVCVLEQLAHPEPFLAKVQELYAHPESTSSDMIEFKDGRVFERYSQPQRIEGRCVGRVWSFHDVTQRTQAEQAMKRQEEQLRQGQKMEAVGQLAGGIAHDFNNILTAVLGNVSLIVEEFAWHPQLHERARDIEAAAQRAATLTRQLLAFSRRSMFELRVVDLNAIVADMQKLLTVTVGDGVELVLLPATSPCPVRVDRGQIEQVMLNLALNARDAMPDGGRLVVTTGLATEGGGPRLDPARAERRVVLTVTDTGSGMDEATRARVFEPFFTTKERGKGTGLGLATAYGIVRQLGGTIGVRSEPGVGTTFEIDLPYCSAPLDPVEPAPPPPRITAPSRAETLLVVEDEAPVRSLMGQTLRRAGYRVMQACNGAAALDLVARYDGPIHLLITDVVMPGLSGRELADRLVTARSDLRVLFISGYADGAIGQHGVLDLGAALLRKPFAGDALVRRVREMLDARIAK